MTRNEMEKYRGPLRELAKRVRGTAADLEEGARMSTGGDAGGNLSNAPMHLGDIGTATYTQELNATLFENEEYIHAEVIDALNRIDAGTFGTCENCRAEIAEGRLEILPYARYCVACAEKLESGRAVNLNTGRPDDRAGVINPRAQPAETTRSGHTGSRPPVADLEADDDAGDEADIHAVGTPGGGTAVGGLAGTNIGRGDPAEADLEEAMGSGNYDVEIDADQAEEAYSGRSGGAVGGTPANKRAVGGKARGGIDPHSDPGDVRTNP